MNKIFKVIWSKSKQCYVVVSEMAKNTTGKKKIIVASVLALLAAQPLVPLHVLAGGMDGGSVKPGTNNNVAYGYGAMQIVINQLPSAIEVNHRALFWVVILNHL